MTSPREPSHLAVSDNGTMAYIPGGAQAASNRLMWVDRKGISQPVELPNGLYFDPRMSPDGTRVAVSWQPITAGSADIWVGDLTRKTFTRLSFSGNAASPPGRPTARRSTTFTPIPTVVNRQSCANPPTAAVNRNRSPRSRTVRTSTP